MPLSAALAVVVERVEPTQVPKNYPPPSVGWERKHIMLKKVLVRIILVFMLASAATVLPALWRQVNGGTQVPPLRINVVGTPAAGIPGLDLGAGSSGGTVYPTNTPPPSPTFVGTRTTETCPPEGCSAAADQRPAGTNDWDQVVPVVVTMISGGTPTTQQLYEMLVALCNPNPVAVIMYGNRFFDCTNTLSSGRPSDVTEEWIYNGRITPAP